MFLLAQNNFRRHNAFNELRLRYQAQTANGEKQFHTETDFFTRAIGTGKRGGCTMIEALFDQATAAVVKARKTSMTATEPVARVAPSSRLWMEISMGRTMTWELFEPQLCTASALSTVPSALDRFGRVATSFALRALIA